MLCELCGKETTELKHMSIERTELMVCVDCAKLGVEKTPTLEDTAVTIDISERLDLRARRLRERDVYAEMPDEELKENYHLLIRDARVARGWTQEELGKKLNERRSVITKLESKLLRPDNRLIAKLQRTLGIKLTEKVSYLPGTTAKPLPELTLGDFIKPLMKKSSKRK